MATSVGPSYAGVPECSFVGPDSPRGKPLCVFRAAGTYGGGLRVPLVESHELHRRGPRGAVESAAALMSSL